MKPSFALDFRDGLVTLLHRTSRGWSKVGSTAFDAPDFVEALGYMRSTALGLSPRGITTKLILPNDQILYTPIHAPGPDAAKRKRQIRAGLEGRTPYPVDDLVYDWWGTGPDLNVAVIARETLAEAEAFATEHRFNPVSFVGVADNGMFLGEPFFGPSALAATILSDGEKVERDADPVTVIARDFSRNDTKAKPAELMVAELMVAELVVAEPVVAEPVVAEPVSVEPVLIEPVVAEPVVAAKVPVNAPQAQKAAPQAALIGEDVDTPFADVAKAAGQVSTSAATNAIPAPATAGAPSVREAVADQGAGPATFVTPQANRAQSLPVVEAAPAPASVQNPIRPQPPKPSSAVQAPEAPMAMDVTPEAEAVLDDVPPAPAAEIVAAFATRRSAAIAAATAGTAGKPAASASVGTGTTAGAPRQVGVPAARIPMVGPAPVQRPTVPRPNVARPAATTARDTVPFPVKPNSAIAKPSLGKSGKPGGASVTAAGIVGVRRERNVVPLPTAGTPEEQAAAAVRRANAKPPTGLGSRSAPIKGKPRYLGLILTVVLLVLLVAVAAWSSFFMGANDTTGTGAEAPAATSPAAISPAASLPAPDAATTATAEVKGTTTAPPTSDVTTEVSTKATAPATQPNAAADTASVAPVATPAADTAAADTAALQSGSTLAAAINSGAANSGTANADSATADSANTVAAAMGPADAGGELAQTSGVITGSAAPQVSADASGIAADATGTPSQTAAARIAALAATNPAKLVAAPVAEPAPNTEVLSAGLGVVVPGTTVQDKIVLAMADTPPKPVGPIALPAVAAGADASPAAEPPPPPYGTVYKFDAEGRIIPTPEGIITPEGVLLIAGKPKLAPPERPANLAPASLNAVTMNAVTLNAVPSDAASAAPAAGAIAITGPIANTVTLPAGAPTPGIAASPSVEVPATETAPVALVQDPTLAGKHPKDKPANLAPAPADQQGAAPTTQQDSRMASLHPAPRPKDLPVSPLAPDTGADASAASASLAANGFALSRSLKPPARPSGLDTAVDTAVTAALKEPAPDTQLASNNVAPEAQVEPDVEAPAPDMPTNASVAKQATIKRAINTNKLALLAVFGTPSTRFAMIRQGNGAVKKIKVGDTVDGGRVAAITENSVQYQKGGRIVTLSLPTG